jgi:hypothetical protein|tara:strand:+ start:245 stop:595 length:351 start_codon:yes stop_codon:yes gene_type:complete
MSVVNTGETEMDKLRLAWEKPYVYTPFPSMVYRGTLLPDGKIEVKQLIVGTEAERLIAVGQGWCEGPDVAEQRVRSDEDTVSEAAAESAAAATKMSKKAQRERATRDKATHRQLTD